MKAFLFSSAAALALAGAVGTASAADLARRPPPPPPAKAPFVVPSYNWTGAYIGINGGFCFRRFGSSGVAGRPARPPFYELYGGEVSCREHGSVRSRPA